MIIMILINDHIIIRKLVTIILRSSVRMVMTKRFEAISGAENFLMDPSTQPWAAFTLPWSPHDCNDRDKDLLNWLDSNLELTDDGVGSVLEKISLRFRLSFCHTLSEWVYMRNNLPRLHFSTLWNTISWKYKRRLTKHTAVRFGVFLFLRYLGNGQTES